jgi:hypothetical protein
MTEKQMRALEGKFAKGESLDPLGIGKQFISKPIFTDEYDNWVYANYKRTGFKVVTETGISASGDTLEEALKKTIPLERAKIAYWEAFFACLDTGRRPRGCPFFNDLIRRDTQSDDDEPSESFGGPLEGPAGHDGGGE